MPKIKYIFRDFWWTVAKIDIQKNGYAAQIAEMYNISKQDVRKALSESMNKFRRWEISESAVWKSFSKNTKLPIHKDSSNVFNKEVDHHFSLYKSIIVFIEKLQKLWYTCVILSDENKPQSTKIKKIWRYDVFDDLILSHDIWISKYDDVKNNTTKIFRYVLQKYKLQSKDAIFIDDREDNCLLAKKVWIKTILAKKPRQTIQDIKKILHI